MLFRKRHYLGVDIGATGLYAVSLRRAGRGTRIAGARSRSLAAGLVQTQPRESNLPRPDELAAGLRELLDPLGEGEERVALSLPDRAGRLFLHEMETPFKNRAEGLDILRWQLKGALPATPKEVALDYQVVSRNENGRYRLLVSAVAKKVLEQYEEVVVRAGYQPVLVDFHSLNVLGFYRPALDLNDDLVLVVVDGSTLVFQYFQNGQFAAQRCREIDGDVERVFQELNRSLAGSRKTFPALARARVYLQSDWEETGPLEEAVTAVFDKPVQLLDPKPGRLLGETASLTPRQARLLVAALGAAGRLM